MSRSFIGVDLAWSPSHPTGLAALRPGRQNLEVLAAGPAVSDDGSALTLVQLGPTPDLSLARLPQPSEAPCRKVRSQAGAALVQGNGPQSMT